MRRGLARPGPARPGPGETPCHLSSHTPRSLSIRHLLSCTPRGCTVCAREEMRVIFLAQAYPSSLYRRARSLPPSQASISPRSLSLSFSLNKSVSRTRSRSRSLTALFLPLRRSVHSIPSRESGNRIPPRDTTAPIKLGSGFYGIHFAFFPIRRQFLPSFRRLDSLSLFFVGNTRGGGDYICTRLALCLPSELYLSSAERC